MQAVRSPQAPRTNDRAPVCIQPIMPIVVQEVQVCTSLPLPLRAGITPRDAWNALLRNGL